MRLDYAGARKNFGPFHQSLYMNLHILGPGFSTFVRSVRLYCEEKGLTYTHGMTLQGQPVEWNSETHRAYHPFGKVPVLIHDGGYVFETNAIFRYLDAAFPERSHLPSDLAARTEIDQWSSALATTVDKHVVRSYLLVVDGPVPQKTVVPNALARAEARVEAMLAILDRQLGERPFLCGERYSSADALVTPMLDYLTTIARPVNWLDAWPDLYAYLERMRARSSGRAVLAPVAFNVG